MMMNDLNPNRRRGAGCPSDFALDRLRHGELKGLAEGTAAACHLRGCRQCQDRIGQMEAVVAPELDFQEMRVLPVSPKVRWQRRWLGRGLWLTPVLAAAVVALFLPGQRPGSRSKGGAWQLGVVAQYPNGRVTGVSEGTLLAPGDRLRFEVLAPKDGFVSVISADATGAITPFAPVSGDTAAVRAGRHLLDEAVRLDDSLGPERLLLVACEQPIAVQRVVAAGRKALDQAGGRLDQMPALDLPCAQRSFWIRKEARP